MAACNIKNGQEHIELSVILQNSVSVMPQIEQILYKNKIAVQKIRIIPSEDDDNKEIMQLVAKYNGSLPTNRIVTEISSLKDVFEVEI